MNLLGNVAVGMVVAGVGFGFAWVRETSRDDGRVTTGEPRESIEVVTFAGRTGQEKGTRVEFNARFGMIPFATFAEARGRLKELVAKLGHSSGYTQMFDPAEDERVLEEIENILALASENELVGFFGELDYSEYWHATTIGMVMAALAKKSPARAIELGSARWKKSENGEYTGLTEMLRAWNRMNPTAVEQWIAGLPEDESLREPAFHIFLALEAAEHPGAVFNRLEEIDPEMGGSIAVVLGERLPLDQMAAAADLLLAEREDGSSSVKMLDDFLRGWGAREPEPMVDWLLEQDVSRLEPEQLNRALGGVIASQPELLLEKLSPALSERPNLTAVAGYAWWSQLSKRGGETAAMDWLAENMAFATGFGEWSIADRAANRVEWTPGADLPDSRSVVSTIRLGRETHIFPRVSGAPFPFQPEVVLPYALEHLPIGSETNSTIAQVVGNWADMGDPEEAVRWSLENLEGHSALDDSVRFAIGRWADGDPSAAAEYALSLPKSVQSDAFRGLAYRWPTKNRDGFLDFVRSAADPEAVSPLTRGGFQELAEQQGGSQFLTTALEMPPGKLRHEAIRGLFGGWALSNTSECVKRIDEVPEGSLRNAAIQGFNGFAGRRDPALVMKLAARITVPELRDRELIFRGKAWLEQDPAAAEIAIRRNPALSNEVKQKILESRNASSRP